MELNDEKMQQKFVALLQDYMKAKMSQTVVDSPDRKPLVQAQPKPQPKKFTSKLNTKSPATVTSNTSQES